MSQTRKNAFVIDSTLVASAHDDEIPDLFVQPLYTVVNDVEYKDVKELDINTFYEKLSGGAEVSSSQPSMGDFLETYQEIKAQGYTHVFVFTLSSGISGTSQTATNAAGLIEGLEINIFDTKICGAPGSIVVQDIMAYAKEHNTTEEILAYAEKLFKEVDIILYIGDLTALQKGGRLSATAAMIGNFFKVKPIVRVIDGNLDVVAKERTQKRGIAKAIELVKPKEIDSVVYLHTNMEEPKEEIIAAFKATYPGIPFHVCGLSSVIGVHIGTNASGIAVRYKI